MYLNDFIGNILSKIETSINSKPIPYISSINDKHDYDIYIHNNSLNINTFLLL